MILRAWNTDSAGNKIQSSDDWNVTVASRAEATAYIASELSATASDEFLHDALHWWITDGKIVALMEDNEVYWNVELDESADSQ